jgi:hypothetical protein
MRKIIRLNENDLLKIIKRVISEGKNDIKFELNFNYYRAVDRYGYELALPLATTKYNGIDVDFSFGSTAFNFTGGVKKERKIPGVLIPPVKVPITDFVFAAEQQFNPALVTPNQNLIEAINFSAKKLAKTLLEVYNKTKNKKSILDYLNEGFKIIGHADGSRPVKTNDLIASNHRNAGANSIYNGITNLYDRNTWLATTRARISYNLFVDEVLKNAASLSDIFDKSLLNSIDNILSLNEDGGRSNIEIVNHLSRDGSATNQIGPEYRRMEFKPKFNTEIQVEPEKNIPARTERYIEPGTKEGETQVPIFRGNEGLGTVPATQRQNPNIKGDLYWGVTEKTIKEFNIPIVKNNKFNGKSIVTGEIKGETMYVDGIDFGSINKSSSGVGGILFDTSGRLFVDMDTAKLFTEGKTKYYEIRYGGFAVTKSKYTR